MMANKLPPGWSNPRLIDLIEYTKGRKPTRLIKEPSEGSKSYLSTDSLRVLGPSFNAPKECLEECLLSDGNCILLIWDGSNSGEVFLGRNGVVSSTMVRVITKSRELDLKYLFYFLGTRFDLLNTRTTGSSIPHVSRVLFENMRVPLPPIEVQHEIVTILDKAEETNRLRVRTKGLTQNLLQSVFLEMFSESNSDYSNWPTVRIEELADQNKGSMRTGPFGSTLRHTEFVDSGVAVLGIDNVVKNSFQWVERRFISPEKYESLECYRVYPSDVLVTIMGTVGRSCVVPPEIPLSISTKHLAVITCDRKICDPQFLSSSIIFHPEIKRQLMTNSKGAIMEGLNLGIIKSLRLHLPPLILQTTYSAIASRIRANQSVSKVSATELMNLFSTFMQEAFTGELVA